MLATVCISYSCPLDVGDKIREQTTRSFVYDQSRSQTKVECGGVVAPFHDLVLLVQSNQYVVLICHGWIMIRYGCQTLCLFLFALWTCGCGVDFATCGVALCFGLAELSERRTNASPWLWPNVLSYGDHALTRASGPKHRTVCLYKPHCSTQSSNENVFQPNPQQYHIPTP
jgi:hypothetical protein